MATMESLIGLVNRIQRACTALGDHGRDSALPTLWEALPSVAVVGGQVLILLLNISLHYMYIYVYVYVKVMCVWLFYSIDFVFCGCEM